MPRIPGLQLDLEGMTLDEVIYSWRGPAPTALEPRLLQKQTAIRPSLMVHRRNVGTQATLELLAGETAAELVSTIPGLSRMTTESMVFADQHPGIIVAFDFPAAEVGTVRQHHALRLDGSTLTTLTLTVDALTLNDATKKHWLDTLASATVVAPGGLE